MNTNSGIDLDILRQFHTGWKFDSLRLSETGATPRPFPFLSPSPFSPLFGSPGSPCPVRVYQHPSVLSQYIWTTIYTTMHFSSICPWSGVHVGPRRKQEGFTFLFHGHPSQWHNNPQLYSYSTYSQPAILAITPPLCTFEPAILISLLVCR